MVLILTPVLAPSGDDRCNEQPQLAVMHTLWLREHNRIASQLALLNSQWEDERIYQVRYSTQKVGNVFRVIFPTLLTQ